MSAAAQVGTVAGDGSQARNFINHLEEPWDSVRVSLSFEQERPRGVGIDRVGVGADSSGNSAIVSNWPFVGSQPLVTRLITEIKESSGIATVTLRLLRDGSTLPATLPMTIGAGAESEHSFKATESENDVSMDFFFGDGSVATAWPEGAPEQPSELPPDDVTRLNETIEPTEYALVTESFLPILQSLVDEMEGIHDDTRAQLHGAVDFIRVYFREFDVDETKRAEVVSVLKSVGTFFFQKAPGHVLQLAGAFKILEVWYPSVVEFVKSLG